MQAIHAGGLEYSLGKEQTPKLSAAALVLRTPGRRSCWHDRQVCLRAVDSVQIQPNIRCKGELLLRAPLDVPLPQDYTAESESLAQPPASERGKQGSLDQRESLACCVHHNMEKKPSPA